MAKFDSRTDVTMQRDGNHEPVPRFERCFDQSAERLWQAFLTHGADAVERHEMPPPADLVEYYAADLPSLE